MIRLKFLFLRAFLIWNYFWRKKKKECYDNEINRILSKRDILFPCHYSPIDYCLRQGLAIKLQVVITCQFFSFAYLFYATENFTLYYDSKQMIYYYITSWYIKKSHVCKLFLKNIKNRQVKSCSFKTNSIWKNILFYNAK